ncbi:MAG: protein-L-isoaspartate(D-aspartate) O-methyltransferase [Gammaproteobacteria bacterium]|nr:protein-L-isoaspartate(D-aspartate) O-methyltransferase [Gammaproteobacteria bacterium]
MAWSPVAKYSGAEIAGIGMVSQRTRDRMVQRLEAQGIRDRRVLEVMASVPRHLFMDEALSSRAYEDVALPIGDGQTISQPYIVARMTEILLAAGRVRSVLEVGTGSGYQAAVLSRLVERVYTCERVQNLLGKARERFSRLGYDNIECRYSDGSWGWPEKGPFDGIIVTAAPESIPDALCEQLAVGGRLVCPVGRQSGDQVLTVVTRTEREFLFEN